MQYYLDQEERDLLDSYAAGEWHSVNEIRTEAERYKEYARATFKKDRRRRDMQKEMVGLAAEFAVASELCRRGMYAQLTLGHLKRTDLLIFSQEDKLLRVEVKGKQGKSWPNCKGIYGHNVMLVFVDFAGKSETERPDFTYQYGMNR